MSPEELATIAATCNDYDVFVLADEVYDHCLFPSLKSSQVRSFYPSTPPKHICLLTHILGSTVVAEHTHTHTHTHTRTYYYNNNNLVT